MTVFAISIPLIDKWPMIGRSVKIAEFSENFLNFCDRFIHIVVHLGACFHASMYVGTLIQFTVSGFELIRGPVGWHVKHGVIKFGIFF